MSIRASEEGNAPGEQTPLLPAAQHGHPDYKKNLIRSAKTLTVLLSVVVAVAGVADAFLQPSWTRILESIVCYRYFVAHDPSKITAVPGPGALGAVDERLCKVNIIQDELARIQGWQTFFDNVPPLVLSIPFGWAADRYGRKSIVTMGFFAFLLKQVWLGLFMWFSHLVPNLDLLWTTSLSFLLGGGQPVTVAVLFTILSDITPSAERTTVFSQFGAANLLPYTFANPLAGALMALNPWIPYLGSALLIALCSFMMLFIPETLNWRANSPSNPPSPPPEPIPETPARDGSLHALSTSTHIVDTLYIRVKNALKFLTSDWRVPVLCVMFLGHLIYATITGIFLQYSTTRYSIDMWVSTMLLSIFYGVKVILLLLVFPQLTRVIRHTFHLNESQKDLYLTRLSFLLLTIGWIMVGLAPNLPLLCIALAIAAAGTGPAYLVLRSFLTALVPMHHVARTYTCVGLLETLGLMFGAPLMAQLFSSGNDLGGTWTGLPFLFLGFLGLLITLTMFTLHAQSGLITHDEASLEEE